MSVVQVVSAGAGGVEIVRRRLVLPLIEDGHRVAVTLTPTAFAWLDDLGECARLERLTGYPVRSLTRLPHETSSHPPADVYVAAPLTANSVAKLALGIADNQALTTLCEGITSYPMVVFPRINAGHARQPAWNEHIAQLHRAGVNLIYGDDVWPLAEHGAGPRELPWMAILQRVRQYI